MEMSWSEYEPEGPVSILPELTRPVIGAAIAVHREVGPGLLESVYEACLVHELRLNGIHVERQVVLPVRYKGLSVESGLRIDLLVSGQLIVEVKSVSELLPIHEAQLLTYLRMSELPVGLLINFNVILLRKGLKRVINRALLNP